MWCIYILRCGDGRLYTGATNRLAHRLAAHANGTGARFTRGRGPLVLVYCEPCADRSEALRREAAVKRLPVARKRAFCAEPLNPPRSRAAGPAAPARA